MINYSQIVNLVKDNQANAAGEILRSVFFKTGGDSDYKTFDFRVDVIESNDLVLVPWTNKTYFTKVGRFDLNEMTIECYLYSRRDEPILAFEAKHFVLVNNDAIKKNTWKSVRSVAEGIGRY